MSRASRQVRFRLLFQIRGAHDAVCIAQRQRDQLPAFCLLTSQRRRLRRLCDRLIDA
jgi:hypothetical protein